MSNQELYFKANEPGRLSDIIGDIPQVSRLPRIVETVATNIENRFDATAQMLISTAVKLEERAADLRQKAQWLLEQKMLAKEVREAVAFEQTSFEEVQSLALVHVGMRSEGCIHGVSFNTICQECRKEHGG